MSEINNGHFHRTRSKKGKKKNKLGVSARVPHQRKSMHLLYSTASGANKCPEVCAHILWSLLKELKFSQVDLDQKGTKELFYVSKTMMRTMLTKLYSNQFRLL